MEEPLNNFINCLKCDKRCYLDKKNYDHLFHFKLDYYCHNCLKKYKQYDFTYEEKEEVKIIIIMKDQ